MPLRYSPASIRSLKAKLRNLFKPSIWASTVGVSLMLVLGWHSVNYLKEQENVASEADSASETPELAETLSPEDSQIAADIENSDVLKELFKEEPQAILTPIPVPESARDEPQGLFDRVAAEGLNTSDVLRRFSGDTPSTIATPENPMVDLASESWSANITDVETGESVPSDIANSYTSTVLPNVLQAALEQTTNSSPVGSTASFDATQPENSAIASPQTASQTPSVAQRWEQQFLNSQPTLPATVTTGVQPTLPDRTIAPQSPDSVRSYSNLTDLKRSSSVVPVPTQPNGLTSPLPGSTSNFPTAVPVAPENYNYNLPSNNTFPGSVAQPTVPYANPYQTVDPDSPALSQDLFEQPQPEPQSSFALDTPIPGRYIGGGEINTFANP